MRPGTPLIQGSGPTDPFRREAPKPAPPSPAPAPVKPQALVQPLSDEPGVLRLGLGSSASELHPGEGAVVTLAGSAALAKASALELTLEWDPSSLEVTGIRAGPWQDERSTVRFEATRTTGHATLQFAQRTGTVGLPSGPLAELSVRAVAPGDLLVRASAGAAFGSAGALRPVVEPLALAVKP